jgi:hypothetical protein
MWQCKGATTLGPGPGAFCLAALSCSLFVVAEAGSALVVQSSPHGAYMARDMFLLLGWIRPCAVSQGGCAHPAGARGYGLSLLRLLLDAGWGINDQDMEGRTILGWLLRCARGGAGQAGRQASTAVAVCTPLQLRPDAGLELQQEGGCISLHAYPVCLIRQQRVWSLQMSWQAT